MSGDVLSAEHGKFGQRVQGERGLLAAHGSCSGHNSHRLTTFGRDQRLHGTRETWREPSVDATRTSDETSGILQTVTRVGPKVESPFRGPETAAGGRV